MFKLRARYLLFFIVTLAFSPIVRAIQEQSHPVAENGNRPQINVVMDCGVKGDGLNDDTGAIQDCIDHYPSHTLLFPKTRASGECDYRLSGTISFHSYSTMLEGAGGSVNNNTTLCWTADVTGIIIAGGQGQALHNLNLRGNSTFKVVTQETYMRGSADGIRVNGGEVTLRDVFVTGFSRHGINVDSRLGGAANTWLFEGVRSESSRGDGFHFSGLDANAGLCLLCIARLNQDWGFYDDAVIPSTFVAPLTEANHNDPQTPSTSVDIVEISVHDKVATVTTSDTHQTIAGDWGVINGCSEFHNKWPIISVPSSTTLQFRTSMKDGVYCNQGSAIYGYQPGARVWAEGRMVHDAEMKATGYNIISSEAGWTNKDMGTMVCVQGAGVDGRELCSPIRLITGNIAVLEDPAARDVHHGMARVVANGGPYNATNSTFIEAYAEGNQEGLSQLMNSLVLGETWGIGANPAVENTIINNGYVSPLKFTRRNILGGYSRSIFQPGRAYGTGNIALDPSYEGYWNTEEMDDRGTVLSSLSFRRSNVTGSAASGWNCFTQDTRGDGNALSASSLCLPDTKTRIASNEDAVATKLPLLPAGGFLVKNAGLVDDVTSTHGMRQIRYDATTAPAKCAAGDIFYKAVPTAGEYMGWVCPAANQPVPFGQIASTMETSFGERVGVPKSSSAECTGGQWAADSSYYYVCAKANIWRRVALSEW